MPAPESPPRDEDTANLPKGVVLDKDGKPCRLCTSAASWRALSKQAQQTPSQSQSQPQEPSQHQQSPFSIPKSISTAASPSTTTTTTPLTTHSRNQSECPPDVEALGRSTWTLLHSLAATYPENATPSQQSDMRTFLSVFSRLYPCWVCADDFRDWMGRNQPRLGGRGEFGWWMCEAHNEVNRKLGKGGFDCRFWEERWRTGWKDGRCD